ncbi:hypothetical protein D9M70_214150 [compost metagenome]
MGVLEDTLQTVLLGQADRLQQARQPVRARFAQRQGLEQLDLDHLAATAQALGNPVGILQHTQHGRPVTLGQRNIGTGDTGHHAQLLPEQAAPFAGGLRQPLLEPAPERPAGVGAAPQRMQADLLTQGLHAEARNVPLLAQGEQRIEQVLAAMGLTLQRGQPRRAEEAHHDHGRRGHPLDHIQPVGQHGRGFPGLAALQQHRGQGTGQHHRHRAAPADILFGLQQAAAQRGLGRDHAPLAQVSHAHDPFADAAQRIEPVAPDIVRSPLEDAPGLLRLALQQGQQGDVVGDDGLQLDRAGGHRLRPMRDDRLRFVRAVGERRRSRRYCRGLAADAVIGRRVFLDLLDQPVGFLMAFAHRQGPGRRQAHARMGFHHLRRQLLDPLLYPAELAAQHDLVQALLDHPVALCGLPGQQVLPRRLLEKPMGLQPARGALVDVLAARLRQLGETLLQELPGKRMDAHPVAVQPFGEDRCGGAELLEQLPCPLVPGHGGAQRGMDHLQQGDAGEEIGLLGGQAGHQAVDEIAPDIAGAGRQFLDGGLQVGTLFDRRDRQLQPQGPALGDFVQVQAEVGVDTRDEAAAEQRDGFLGTETQGLHRDPGIQSARQEVGGIEVQTPARSHDDAQVGRRVVQQVGQALTDGRLGQCIDLIEDQHRFATEVGHFRQPVGQPLQLIAATARHALTEADEGRPAAAQRHCGCQPLGEAAAIIVAVQHQPGDHRPARQELPAPLRQQHGLAETGRRLHGDDHLVRQLRRVDAEPFPQLCAFLAARRRGLEHQLRLYAIHVGDASLQSRTRHEGKRFSLADGINAFSSCFYRVKVVHGHVANVHRRSGWHDARKTATPIEPTP